MKSLILLLALPAIGICQIPTISSSASVLQESQTATITCLTNCTSLVWKVNGITNGNSTVGTITGSGSSVTFTAPASTTSPHIVGGCAVGFPDLFWYVPLSAIPQISNWRGDSFLNSAWFTLYTITGPFGVRSSGTIGLDNTHPLTNVNNSTSLINFYGVEGGGVIHNIPWTVYPNHLQEGGLYDFNANANDHHTEEINTDTCDNWELYNTSKYGTTSDTLPCPTGGGTCFYGSSWAHRTPATSTAAYSWSAGTNAAGTMLSPGEVTLAEIRSGVIKHAIYARFPRDGSSAATNLMWPASFGNGYCSGKDVVGLSGFPTGTGYASGTTITFTGGGGGANGETWNATVVSGVITGATLASASGNGNNYTSVPTVVINDPGGLGSGAVITPTIDLPCYPYGVRMGLDATYLSNHTEATPGSPTSCPAGSNCIDPTTPGYVIAVAFRDYGIVDLDNTQNSIAWTGDIYADIQQGPGVKSSINSAISKLPFSQWHFYDDTSLAKSTLTGRNPTLNNDRVVPDNDAGYIPPGVAWITATNGTGQSFSSAISLIPVTIGTIDTELPVLAGDYSGARGTNGGYQIPVQVHGTANTAVTFSCSTCAANGSSVNATTGVYTPPTAVTATGLQDIVTVTSSADTNVTASVYFDILPNSGNFSTDTIRADIGYTSTPYADGNGHWWVGNIGSYSGDLGNNSQGTPFYHGTGESKIFQTGAGSLNIDMNYKIIVPNQNYTVRVMTNSNNGGTTLLTMPTSYFGYQSPVNISGGDNGFGGVQFMHWPMMLKQTQPFSGGSNAEATFGEKVSNNILTVSEQGDYLANPNQTPITANLGWSRCSGFCTNDVMLAGLDIEPDTTSSPHWVLNCTNWINNGATPSTFTNLSDSPTVALGGQLLVYPQDWYTGVYDPIYSIISGPGTIVPSAVNLQLNQNIPAAIYTAPISSTDMKSVLIQAQSQSNPSIKAVLAVNIQSGFISIK